MDSAAYYMIPQDVYMTTGKKSFWLLFSHKISVSIGFFIIALIVSLAQRNALVPAEFQKLVALVDLVLWSIFAVSAIIAYATAKIVHKSRKFCLAPDAFKMRTGVFSTSEIAIPYRQVQSVDLERSLEFRMIGVSKLTITSAATDDPTTPENDATCVIAAIDKDLASNLQSELLRRADIQKTHIQQS